MRSISCSASMTGCWPRENQQERIKMREELVELLTVRFIDRLVLKVDDLQVWVYFKPRRNRKQDVLTIAISAREDGEGRIEHGACWTRPRFNS